MNDLKSKLAGNKMKKITSAIIVVILPWSKATIADVFDVSPIDNYECFIAIGKTDLIAVKKRKADISKASAIIKRLSAISVKSEPDPKWAKVKVNNGRVGYLKWSSLVAGPCGIVSSYKKLEIYKVRSKKSEIVARASRFSALKVKHNGRLWVQVENDKGVEGYVDKNYIRVSNSKEF